MKKKDFDIIIDDGFGLLLSSKDRQRLWKELYSRLEKYLLEIESYPVSQNFSLKQVRESIKEFDFSEPLDPIEVLNWVADNLTKHQLHIPHPSYHGVFNPHPSTMGIVAETLVAAFNPQLASSASGRFCIAIEDHLLKYFGRKFGYPHSKIKGIFTSGGTEANHSALLCALVKKVPQFRNSGLQNLDRFPLIYTTKETHGSISRAARLCGLGTESVRELPVTYDLKFDCNELRKQIQKDLKSNKLPLFLTATMGSTSAGIIDPLETLGDIAKEYNMWLHIDAAWGGALCLLEEFYKEYKGIEKSDSITFDPHKWLSIPMGSGIFLTQHPLTLMQTFEVNDIHYMPKETHVNQDSEPYRQSMQWSRRFIGLKLFMTLLCHGEKGYQEILHHQINMGYKLKKKLKENSWEIVNQTSLPVICFKDPVCNFDIEKLCRYVTNTGKAWITTTKLKSCKVLRAGIPNFITQEKHLDLLIEILNEARNKMMSDPVN